MIGRICRDLHNFSYHTKAEFHLILFFIQNIPRALKTQKVFEWVLTSADLDVSLRPAEVVHQT